MKIAVSGTQCVGKTTTLNLIKKSYLGKSTDFSLLKEHKIGGSNTQEVLKYNELGLSEQSSDSAQLIILSNFIKDAYTNNLISDRCILDYIVYTELLYKDSKCSFELYNLSKKIYNELISKYDLIFYFPPEIDIIDNGIRSVNEQYRNKLHKTFLLYIEELDNVHIIRGNPEFKYIQISNLINNTSLF